LKTNGHYFSVTNLIESLSEKHGIPPSTLRWNIKQLRELQLIECGTYLNKGVPAKLTPEGRLISEILDHTTANITAPFSKAG